MWLDELWWTDENEADDEIAVDDSDDDVEEDVDDDDEDDVEPESSASIEATDGHDDDSGGVDVRVHVRWLSSDGTPMSWPELASMAVFVRMGNVRVPDRVVRLDSEHRRGRFRHLPVLDRRGLDAIYSVSAEDVQGVDRLRWMVRSTQTSEHAWMVDIKRIGESFLELPQKAVLGPGVLGDDEDGGGDDVVGTDEGEGIAEVEAVGESESGRKSLGEAIRDAWNSFLDSGSRAAGGLSRTVSGISHGVSSRFGVSERTGTLFVAATAIMVVCVMFFGTLLVISAADPALYDDYFEDCVEDVDALRAGDADDHGPITDEEGIRRQMTENAKRVYSVFSAYGLTDEQIAGMLGNFECECAIDPTTIEGIYDEHFSMSGPRKSKIATSEKALSDWTIQLLTMPHNKGYGGHLDPDGHVRGATTPIRFYKVNSDFYGPGGPKNLFYPGIGIGSWTGYAQVSAIIELAEKSGVDWWDLDYQIACCIVLPGTGGHGDVIYQRYHADCPRGSSPEACAEWFVAKWEGCPGNTVGIRQAAARRWYDLIKAERWSADTAYANHVIKIAEQLGESSVGKVVSRQIAKECKRASQFDNSTIAKALVSYSYSRYRTKGEGYKGTSLYEQVFAAVAPGDGYFRSCDRAVACAIRWSGADENFPLGACSDQNDYAMKSPDWEHVCDFQASSPGKAALMEAERAGLQPGDCLFTYPNQHTMAFVGEEAVEWAYDNVLKGTDADVDGGYDEYSAWVSGSIGVNGTPSTYDSGPDSGRAPCIGVGRDACSHPYGVFRYLGDYPSKDKFEGVGEGLKL